MKALVTGAGGFLGSFLCDRLARDGHEVTQIRSRSVDLRQADALEPFSDQSFDLIFHLAAWTQAGDFCLHHPGEQWINNQRLNTTVLSWWRERQPQAYLVTIGTSCAYDPLMPLKEENYFAGTPIDSLFTYAMTKRMVYAGQLAMSRQYGMKSLCVVPSTLYGPGYHTDGRQMHFIFDLIRKILRGKLRGEPVELWGNGHQRRELVFAADFVDVLMQLVDNRSEGLVNIGTGLDHSIREFAGMICDRVGYDPASIQYDETKYVGAKSKTLVPDKLNQLMPDARFTPLRDGLDQTITWFEEKGAALL
ncbi:MAG: NAD-dependent epimerase/dehydratase family protein [Planctomycetota bacterium]